MLTQEIEKVYFAGALFTLGERLFNAQLVKILREKYNYDIFLPQEKQGGTIPEIFVSDKENLANRDIVLAIVDNADVDSGTCWEIGYGYALGKKIIQVRTDFRVLEKWGNEFRPTNLMIFESADKVIEYYGQDLEELAQRINQAIADIKAKIR